MRLADHRFLTDENIDRDVMRYVCSRGCDVLDVAEEGLFGKSDAVLLRRAVAEQRVIVTHDSDFGTLAIQQGEPVIGVIYLRPGHISPPFTIGTLAAVLDVEAELQGPFLLVARRTGDESTSESELCPLFLEPCFLFSRIPDFGPRTLSDRGAVAVGSRRSRSTPRVCHRASSADPEGRRRRISCRRSQLPFVSSV